VACYFYAIARLRLADAVLLNQSMPLFIPLVERAWLGERMPPRLWGVLSLGFAGLLLILRPGTGVFEPAALLGLASAVLASVAQVGHPPAHPDRAGHAHRLLLRPRGLGRLALAPALATWARPSPSTWAVLLLMGVFATVGQLTLTRAYVHAPAARVGPFLYTGPVFAGLLDWLLWGHLPDRLFVLGAAIVVAAATLALRLRGAPRAPLPAS
jgi:drug/metabolite transporter (DMT)-like permease